jgi:hypothetical protein
MPQLETQKCIRSVRWNGHVLAQIDQLHPRHIIQRQVVVKVVGVPNDDIWWDHFTVPRFGQKFQHGFGRIFLFANFAVAIIFATATCNRTSTITTLRKFCFAFCRLALLLFG